LLTQEIISVRDMIGGVLIVASAYIAARPALDS
jgi:drug/metabolite transporter (DMT)-like permease